MINNTLCILLLIFSSYAVSISLKNRTDKLSCDEISSLLSQLKSIEKDIDNIRNSFIKRVELLATASSENSKKLIESKQELMNIVEEDIKRLKVLKIVFTDLQQSLDDINSKDCKQKATAEIEKVKKNISSFIQLMKTDLRKLDNQGTFSKQIALLEIN
jgi:hypothetical protein